MTTRAFRRIRDRWLCHHGMTNVHGSRYWSCDACRLRIWQRYCDRWRKPSVIETARQAWAALRAS